MILAWASPFKAIKGNLTHVSYLNLNTFKLISLLITQM